MYATARAGRRGSRVLTCWPRYVQKSYFLPSFLPSEGCNRLASLTLPNSLTSLGNGAYQNCSRIRSLKLPNTLTDTGRYTFNGCTSLTSVSFRVRLSPAFIVWSLSSMRNRSNWKLTTVNHLRNVLAAITAYSFEVRDVSTVDPGGRKGVFSMCPFAQPKDSKQFDLSF